MKFLMESSRTWACPYNLASWCVYVSETHACYAQDLAPETSLHKKVLEYRDLEMDMYKALDHSSSRSTARFETLACLLIAKRKEILGQTQPNLHACAFWPLYKAHDHHAVINKTDPNIPRLVARGELLIKGRTSGPKMAVGSPSGISV
jgi:hypothetical protein